MTFQLTIMTREIASALALVAPVIDKSSAVPILKTVRIAVTGGIVEFVGTNTVQTIIARAACSGSGAIAIDAASLDTKIRALRQSDPVTLTQDDGFVTVSQARTRWKTPCLPASDFPGQVADPVKGEAVRADASLIAAAMAVLPNAAVNNPARAHLEGVHMGADIVATDGHSMGLIASDVDVGGAIVPSVAVHMLAKMTGEIDVTKSEGSIQFATQWLTVKTQLVEGTYPDIRRIIPIDLPGMVTVNREDLRAAINRAGAIGSDGEKSSAYVPVVLKIRANEVEIQASNRAGEEGSDFVTCSRVSGDDIDIRFSRTIIMRGVDGLDCDAVEIRYLDEKSPMIISPVASDRENIRIVMPRRK